MNWQSFPATETTLRFFAAYLADQVSFKTIKLYLTGIRFAHTENSLPDPFQEAPLLRLLLLVSSAPWASLRVRGSLSQ